MTYENCYKPDFDRALSAYVDKYKKALASYEEIPIESTEIAGLITIRKKLEAQVQSLKGVGVVPLNFNVEAVVQQAFQNKRADKEMTTLDIHNRYEQLRQKAVDAHNSKEQQVNAFNEQLVAPIEAKHRQLLAYDKQLTKVFERYNITPLDMTISDDTTQKEFLGMLDSSLAICEEFASPKPSLFDKVLAPLQTRRDLPFVLGYCLLIAVGAYFTLPFLTILVFINFYKSVRNMCLNVDKLKLAKSLMSQIDYKRFVPKDMFQVLDPLELKQFQEDEEAEIASLPDLDAELEGALSEVRDVKLALQQQADDTYKHVCQEFKELLDRKTAQLNVLNKRIDTILKDYKPFPTHQTTSLCMNHEYVVGRFENTLDVKVKVPNKNIVFDSSDAEKGLRNLKLYLCNMLLSVRVKQLTVEIFDPKNLCSAFAEFFTKETQEYIKVVKDDLNKTINDARSWAQSNIIELDDKTLDEYNEQAERTGIVPKPYRLLILVSETEKYLKEGNSAVFKEFFKYSAEKGMHIWLFSQTKLPGGLFVAANSAASNCVPIDYSAELGRRAMETFTDSLNNFKGDIITYADSIGTKYIPPEKWWTFDTIKGIEMHWGLENGDPNKGYPLSLNDGQVHALLGGATGAGKSAAINQMLVSLVTMYPPSELLLVYIDFKNVEAAKFTHGYDNGWMSEETQEEKLLNEEFFRRVSRIPQARIISGTTDGEYALSVFEFLIAEMERRKAICNKAGVTKVQELRERLLDRYCKEKNVKVPWYKMRQDWDWYKKNVYDVWGDLPRLLVVFDEFQVMFNTEFVPSKIIESIKGKITAFTKLARAYGGHLWFTSQSMKGTLSQDTMSNFFTRAALRCTKDVSQEILGNEAAGTITAQFGYLYTNTSAGQDKKQNKLWRVPFLKESLIPDYLDKLNNMLDDWNEKSRMAEFYDEKVLVPADVMGEWYTKYPDTFNNPDVFVLGERASFSTNAAPITLVLSRETGENVMIAGFDKTDIMNMCMTMIDNIKASGANFLINCQDKATYAEMQIDKLVAPEIVDLTKPDFDVSELVNTLNEIADARLAADPINTPPMYVILMQWENAPGVCVDASYKVQEIFKEVLRKGPLSGMHFIIVCKDKGEMTSAIPRMCSHRIGGLLPTNCYFFMVNANSVEKLPARSAGAGNFAIYELGNDTKKFRIYQHEFHAQVREVVI